MTTPAISPALSPPPPPSPPSLEPDEDEEEPPLLLLPTVGTATVGTATVGAAVVPPLELAVVGWGVGALELPPLDVTPPLADRDAGTPNEEVSKPLDCVKMLPGESRATRIRWYSEGVGAMTVELTMVEPDTIATISTAEVDTPCEEARAALKLAWNSVFFVSEKVEYVMVENLMTIGTAGVSGRAATNGMEALGIPYSLKILTTSWLQPYVATCRNLDISTSYVKSRAEPRAGARHAVAVTSAVAT